MENENILVVLDENNLIHVDPNSVINNGVVSARNIKQENLVIYVNLEVDLVPRTKLKVTETENWGPWSGSPLIAAYILPDSLDKMPCCGFGELPPVPKGQLVWLHPCFRVHVGRFAYFFFLFSSESFPLAHIPKYNIFF
jgi:hypothetical protein